MTLSLIWLPLLVAHTAAISVQAPVAEAPRFASAVASLADKGYELRDLNTRATAGGIEVSMVLADARDAQALTVFYSEEKQSFSSFHQRAAALPSETRHYAFGAELLEELSLSAPQRIAYDCADFYLDFGSKSVSLAENAFEVEIRQSTRRPGAALAGWLRELLAAGELVDIRDELFDDGATVSSELVFVFEGNEGIQELRVETDSKGRVEELRLVHSPATEVFRRYKDGDTLRTALRGPIASLNFVFADGQHSDEYQAAHLELRMTGGSGDDSIRIDMNAFEDLGFDGCGC